MTFVLIDSATLISKISNGYFHPHIESENIFYKIRWFIACMESSSSLAVEFNLDNVLMVRFVSQLAELSPDSIPGLLKNHEDVVWDSVRAAQSPPFHHI